MPQRLKVEKSDGIAAGVGHGDMPAPWDSVDWAVLAMGRYDADNVIHGHASNSEPWGVPAPLYSCALQLCAVYDLRGVSGRDTYKGREVVTMGGMVTRSTP